MRKEVAMKSSVSCMITLAFYLPWGTAQAADESPVRPFQAQGVIADVQELFPLAAKNARTAGRNRASAAATGAVGSRVLVTPTEVYAFLETPENQKLLKGVRIGTAVSVQGQLLVSGSLLHLDRLARPTTDSGVDLCVTPKRREPKSISRA